MVLRKGFTLIELLVVMGILAIFVFMLLIVLNPLALTNRARDAQRKKDLNRLKLAFEEYFNDKGCYPIKDSLKNYACGQSGFTPWLSYWPCDPDGSQYIYITEPVACPHYYKIYTNLKYLKDPAIPGGWYNSGVNFSLGDGTINNSQVNFGVSSSNVQWADRVFDPICTDPFGHHCYLKQPDGNGCTVGAPDTKWNFAYLNTECSTQCQVTCCLNGYVCN